MQTRPCLCLLLCAISAFYVFNVGFAATCYEQFSTADFPHCKSLSPTVALHWHVDGSNITFGLVADTDGPWVAFGLSEAGGMFAADLWVVSQDDNGDWAISDYYSVAQEPPAFDEKQSLSFIGTPTRESGKIVAVVTRLLDTCDSADIPIRFNHPQSMVWAMGDSPFPSYHGPVRRGDSQVNLLPPRPPALPVGEGVLPEDVMVLEFRMSNFTIPSDTTTYQCQAFKMPSDRKYHVIAFEGMPVTNMTHHMLFLACTGRPENLGESYECASMQEPCSTISPVFWSPGFRRVYSPPAAGMPIGTEGDIYFSVQVHYNNPMGLEGVVDTSGFKLYVTPTLRDNDLGTLAVGQESFTIPGNTPYVPVTPGICPEECTKTFPTDLTMVASFMHMHTLGKSIVTRHLRRDLRGNWKELQPLANRSSWHYTFQSEASTPPDTATLARGDVLITECVYNSMGRDQATYFGENTQDEMCYNFITYYPRMKDVNWCTGVTESLEELVSTCTTFARRNELNEANGLEYLLSGWVYYGPQHIPADVWSSSWPRWRDPVCVPFNASAPAVVAGERLRKKVVKSLNKIKKGPHLADSPPPQP